MSTTTDLMNMPKQRSYPWRRYVTPYSTLLAYPFPGAGTSTDPYIVSWLPVQNGVVVDVEQPMSWSGGRKWGITMIGAVSVLSVTMASSVLILCC